MTPFLDRPPPYDFSDPAGRNLWDLLSANYQSKAPVRDLMVQASIASAEIYWDQPMRWAWQEILELAVRQGKLKGLLQLIMDGGDAAIGTRIKELLADSAVTSPPPPPLAMTWKGFDDDAAAGAERIIEAESTLLDIAFLRRGIQLSTAVCRLLVTMSGKNYYGTAFRIADDLLLTNHHVLFDEEHDNAPATAAEAWFGFERTFAGLDMQPTVVAADVATIVGEPDHDWAVVKLQSAMPADSAIVELTGAKPVKPDDRVYIIQHPGGAPKKIGMIHNVVRSVDDNVLQYLTDTEGGSSGSPVFNEEWGLVALHHRWVETKANGVTEIRNQGRRIERVVEGLQAARVL
jgi:V8-like Glu-specific endopeptidase